MQMTPVRGGQPPADHRGHGVDAEGRGAHGEGGGARTAASVHGGGARAVRTGQVTQPAALGCR